jgi:ABC-type nitrate/sulfonate/bicarbonate transport system substrate-binding protein
MRRLIILTVFALLLPFNRHDGFAQSKDLTRIKLTYSAMSAATLVTWVAKDAGIFQKHGLEVGLVYISGGTMAMATTIAGETQITQGAGTGSILAKLSGADTVMIASILDTTNQSLMVLPDIRASQDLKGKRLGVTRYGSLSDFGTRRYLQQVGLVPEKDVQILQIGGLPEILAAMQGGSIQGGAISSPTLTRAKLLGYRELVDLGTLGIKYPATSFLTTESYIKSHRPVLIQFLKGIVEAAHFVKANKDASINVLRKYTKTNEMPILEDTYQIYVQRYIRLVPTSSPEEVKTVLDQVKDKDPRARTTDYDSFIRGDLLREIEQSGFLKTLNRG